MWQWGEKRLTSSKLNLFSIDVFQIFSFLATFNHSLRQRERMNEHKISNDHMTYNMIRNNDSIINISSSVDWNELNSWLFTSCGTWRIDLLIQIRASTASKAPNLGQTWIQFWQQSLQKYSYSAANCPGVFLCRNTFLSHYRNQVCFFSCSDSSCRTDTQIELWEHELQHSVNEKAQGLISWLHPSPPHSAVLFSNRPNKYK